MTTSPDNRVRFGDVVLIKCEGTANKERPLIAKNDRTDCFLSSSQTGGAHTAQACGVSVPVLNDRTALTIQRFDLTFISLLDCKLFIILVQINSVDGTLLGNSIKFGQPFTICSHDKSVTHFK